MWLRGAPNTARRPRRLVRPVVAAAVAVGLAPWGCGGTSSPDPDPTTRRTGPTASTARSGAPATRTPRGRARSAAAPRATSRADRLREFRRWIVWRFRIPGMTAARAARGDPIDQLRRSLSRLYGPPRRGRPPDLSTV
jgi:hypothetical protein